MKRFSRRAFVLAAGAAFIAQDFIFYSSASAYYYFKNADGANKCVKESGNATYWDKPGSDGNIGYCDTPKDLECMIKLQDKTAYYNMKSEQCGFDDDDDDDEDVDGSGGSRCFLTTACVHHIGLEDDCFELRTLRAFRDTVLTNLPEGPEDIERYYAEAPALLRCLNATPNGKRELCRLYILYILPSAMLAKLQLNSLTHRTYRAMMHDLTKRLATD